MIALIRWGLKQRKWYTIWWTLGVSVFVAVQLGFYSSFKGQFNQLNETLAGLPEGVKGLIGDSGNYFSPETYLNSRVFYLVVPLMFAILMIGLFSSLLAREEEDGTLEVLLARPVSRTRLLLGKAFCGLAITIIVAAVSLAVCIALSRAVGIPNSVAEITAAMLLTYLLCLVFGAFAFMLSAVSSAGRRLAVGLTTCLFITSYVLTGLVGAAEWLKWPAKLLPYYYFDPQRMLTGDYAWGTVAAYGVAIIGFAIIAWIGFRRRDVG